MVKLLASLSLLAGILGLTAACQSIAGIDDKQLDPSLGAGGTAGATDAGLDADADAAVDAPADAPPDVPDDDSGPDGATPPTRPDGDAGPSGTGLELTFAARRFFLGTYDPNTDALNADVWRRYGFDYDGMCTSSTQSDTDTSGVCLRPDKSSTFSQEDGDACRDNVLGHMMAAALVFADPSFELKAHNETRSGEGQTLILQILDLDPGPDDPYAPARMYVSAPKTTGMLWDGNDLLAVDGDSVEDGGLDQPRYQLLSGYVRDNVWVSGDFKGDPISMPMMVLNYISEIPAVSASLTVKLSADHTAALDSHFGAVLDPAELEPMLHAGMLIATDCDPTKTALGMSMIMPNRDLGSVSDGFVTPTQPCSLMSIAVGLEWKRVKPPLVVQDVPEEAIPCLDAGPG